MKNIKFMFAVLLLVSTSSVFAQSIAKEMQSLSIEQYEIAEEAMKKGDIEFTAEQAGNLFEDLDISTGVIPGEERVGFVVCTNSRVSMGNIDIARCRIQSNAPSFIKVKRR